MTPCDEGLRKQHMEVGLLDVQAVEPDVIAKEVIRQQMICQVVEEVFRRLVEDFKGLQVDHARVIVFEHATRAKWCHHPMLQALPHKHRAVQQTPHVRCLQHQARFMAEAGERAYFRLCWIRWIASSVTGPCVCHCCRRASEKPLRTSA